MTNESWLIEREGPIYYAGELRWTTNALEALRFISARAAQRVAKSFPGARVVAL